MQHEEWKSISSIVCKWVEGESENGYSMPEIEHFLGYGRLASIIQELLQKERSAMRQKMMKMITDEIAICHTEGTPTARLTSLYVKLSALSEIEV